MDVNEGNGKKSFLIRSFEGILVTIVGGIILYIAITWYQRYDDKNKLEADIKSKLELGLSKNDSEAILIFEDVLKKVNKDDFPEYYIKIKGELALRYKHIGGYFNNLDYYEKTFKYLDELRNFNKINDFPLLKALNNLNLGAAYFDLSKFRDTYNNSINGISFADSSLAFFQEKKDSYHSGINMMNKGLCYQSLARIDIGESNLLNAKNCLNFSLPVFNNDNDKDKSRRAILLANLGLIYDGLYQFTHSKEYLDTSIIILNRANEFATIEENQFMYERIKHHTGRAYIDLASVTGDIKYTEDAITEFKKALKISLKEKYPYEYSQNIFGIGMALCMQAFENVGNSKLLFEQSIGFQKESQSLISLEKYPIDLAETDWVLGRTYFGLSFIGDRKLNLDKSIELYQEALGIFKQYNYSYMISYLNNILDNSYTQLKVTDRKLYKNQKFKLFQEIIRVNGF